MFIEVINMYGAEIARIIIIVLFGIFGMAAKRIAERVLDTPVKQKLAKLVVQFVEQAYRELHGADKLNAALITLSDLLAQKRIHATEAEMKVLIEAAVAEFNEVFKKPLLNGSTSAATYRPYEGPQQSDPTGE